jgi:restriction endonuclease Mrr
MKEDIQFDDFGPCDICREVKPITKNGICSKCFKSMLEHRSEPWMRNSRLKALAKSEAGIIQFAKRIARSQTSQTLRPFRSKLEEHARRDETEVHARLKRLSEATPSELAEERAAAPYARDLFEISDQLFRRIQARPSELYRMPPEKFEEFMAELLERMGLQDVEVTQRTRDKGRDIRAKLKVSIGELLIIVECKRYAAARKVGLAVVERFLWTIRETDRASCGLIATTSFFSADAKAKAKEFQYKLHLADIAKLKTWIGQVGTWRKQEGSELWVPAAPPAPQV